LFVLFHRDRTALANCRGRLAVFIGKIRGFSADAVCSFFPARIAAA
jgi:hypothetical protein